MVFGRNHITSEMQFIFNRMSKMERPAVVTVLWVGALLMIVISDQAPSVCSAPVSSTSNNQSFYDRLYRNGSKQNCFLQPRVSDVNYNYTRSKVNQLCDSNIVAEENVKPPKKDISICNSLTVVFQTLCRANNNSKSIKTSVVDLLKVGTLGVKKVCMSLKEIISNVSKVADGLVSPFKSSGSNEDTTSCLSICKNSREIREGFSEYSKLEVHPVCILLLEGYTTYQETRLGLNQGTLNGVTKSAVITENLSLGSTLPSSNAKSDADTKSKKQKTPESVTFPAAPQDAHVQKQGHPDEDEDVATTDASTDDVDAPNKKVPFKQPPLPLVGPDNSVNSNKNQVSPEKSSSKLGVETVTPLSKIEPLRKNSSLVTKDEKLAEQPKNQIVHSDSAQSSSTSTTAASLDAKANEEPLPMENESKLKSSTAIPSANDGVGGAKAAVTDINRKETNRNDKISSGPGISSAEKHKDKDKMEQQETKPQSKPTIKNEDADIMAELVEEDAGDYNPGEESDNGVMKPGSKFVDDNKENVIPQPEIQNRGREYAPDSSFRPSDSRFAGNTYREDLDFSRGTTINVSLKESEDTGFFNYFLFSVTLVGLMYLVIHNKKKLIAFVVEGKRPRSRSRRNSSSSQYRRLENNFD